MLRYIEKEVFHYRCFMHYGWQGLAVLDEEKTTQAALFGLGHHSGNHIRLSTCWNEYDIRCLTEYVTLGSM